MDKVTFTKEQHDALKYLIDQEQVGLTNDEDNEFWNVIRRKLRSISRIDSHWCSYKVLQ